MASFSYVIFCIFYGVQISFTPILRSFFFYFSLNFRRFSITSLQYLHLVNILTSTFCVEVVRYQNDLANILL